MAWLVISALFLGSSALSDACITPGGNRGRCVLAEQCPFIREQLQKISTIQEYRYVTSFHCGYDPTSRKLRVCCPSFSNAEDCGTIGFSDRIYEGTETDLDEFPWMALLGYRRKNKTMFRCGGSLINDRYVLTAAHCVTENDEWKLDFVRLGEWDLDTSPDCVYDYFGELHCNEVHEDFGIQKVIVHEKFTRNVFNIRNDIALLKLDKRVVSTEFIAPICIPTQKQADSLNIQQLQLFVAGWGATETEANSKRKLKTILQGHAMARCAKVFRKKVNYFAESQLCVGGKRGRDSCRGDSGGPLMEIFQNRWHVVGIVSFGSGLCGLEGMPALYTRVGSFLDWVAGKIELESRR
ncbi:serine protease [Culex quinquefasciatus]|uniref:CLIP domain-containing serine protease n=1 Tax=Culex quinquefasciatus TaxID=7176 RepID=B0XAU6_CULQU|nr:serine protease [Culex quinquefasciatus]|eukprot:XP_001866768.1 serine protease [Culex quinquefasciatus]